MNGDTFGRQMTTVGDRIRERRLALGLSQRELACEGVTYAYMSRLEANTRQPSVKALRKIAPKLGVSPHWLETGEDDPAEEIGATRLGASRTALTPSGGATRTHGSQQHTLMRNRPPHAKPPKTQNHPLRQ
jgi:transcriptional regulator with XRE-family HTH domain